MTILFLLSLLGVIIFMGETVMEKSEGRVSLHDTVEEMLKRIREDGLTNVFDRYAEQEKIRCKFCLQGLSCQLCSQGPCRINEKTPRGVCGIEADAMAMRKQLYQNCMGAATYAHHAYQAFRTLKSTGEAKTPFQIKDVNKLKFMCQKLGIDINNKDNNQLAIELGDFLEGEMHKDYDSPATIIEAFAPAKRKEVWRKIGIFPAGVMYESQDALASCLTNVDGDYVSMAKKALRLGIATIYTAQIPLEMVQDILFGTPMPHEVQTDLGIMDADYVNIVFNGHQPWVAEAVLAKAYKPEYQQKAKDIGAKGLRVVGSIETGQELIQRHPTDNVFVGLMGDWLSIEPFIATGTVDVFAMEENCSPPSLRDYADKYQATLVSINDIVRTPGLDVILDYKPPAANEISEKLIELALENFKKRKDKVKPVVPKRTQKAVAGFSTEAVLGALGNKLDPLVDVIAAGKIKGVVALASCTTLRNGPQGNMVVGITKELIKRDILVVSGGCGNHALEVEGMCTTEATNMAGAGLKEVCNMLKIPPVLSFGTCTDVGRMSMLVTALAEHLGVDIPDLPIAVTAPEYMEQKATIDGMFALAYGTYTHLSPVPFVTGAPKLVKLLTEDLEGLTGGKLALSDDPVEAAEGILAHINSKRQKLGLK